MLRLFVFLSFSIVSFGLSGQTIQYAWNYYEDGRNPKQVWRPITDSNYPNVSVTTVLQGPIWSNRWTSTIPLPFPFVFFGDTISHIRASTNGLVTLDTLDTALVNVNTSLPNPNIPAKCISAYWTNFTNSPPLNSGAEIKYFTVGQVPDRQFWLRWEDFELGPNASLDPVNFAVVLEEGTHTIYMVDINSADPNPITGYSSTVGIQDYPNFYTAGSTINLQGNSNFTNDNDYFEFFLLDSLNVGIESFTTLDTVFCGGLVPLGIEVRNFGYTPIDSLVIGYGWNGPGTFDTIGGLNIGPNEVDTLLIDTLFFLAGNTYDFEFYVQSVNGVLDEDQSNDTLNIPGVKTGLSGNYTVDPTQPTSGTNYQSLSEVAHALNNWGLCGPVAFTLAPGSFDDNLYLGEIKGSSVDHTISFFGDAQDSSVITHDAIGKKNIIRLSGTDFIRFERLHFFGTGTALGSAESIVRLEQGADSVVFDQCSFNWLNHHDGILASGGGYAIWASRDSVQASSSLTPICNRLTVTNSRFIGGTYGVFLDGDINGADIEGIRIEQNVFEAGYVTSINLIRSQGISIRKNHISTIKLGGSGINMDDVVDFSLLKNEVYANTNGIYLRRDESIANNPKERVENNIFSSASATGAYVWCNGVALYNNTIKGRTSGLVLRGDMAEVSLLNNIIYGDTLALIRTNASYTLDTSNYNLLFSGGSELVQFNAIFYSDLSSFQVAHPSFESASIEGEPIFRRANNLRRIDTIANNGASNQITVLTDIDGASRNQSGFDIGADEFTNDSIDLDIIRILSPTGLLCNDTAQGIEVVVRNNGLDSITMFPYTVSYIGTPSSFSYSDTMVAVLQPLETDTLLLAAINTMLIDTGRIFVHHSLANDAVANNDTVESKLIIAQAYPQVSQLIGDTLCAPDSIATYSALGLNGTGRWYESSTSDSVLSTNSTFTEAIETTTTRYLGLRNSVEYSVGHVEQPGDSMGVLFVGVRRLLFENDLPFTLDSVTVYPGDTGWLQITALKYDEIIPAPFTAMDTLMNIQWWVEPDSAFSPVRVPVGISFEPGAYALTSQVDLNPIGGMLRTAVTVDFPYVVPKVLKIIGSSYYYWFYDWSISVEGCQDSIRYPVTAYYEDSELSLPNDASICQEDSLNIIPTTSGGTFNSFLWMDGSTGPSYTATGASTISVVGESTLGCVHEDFMVVDTFPSTPTMVPQDTTICDTDVVVLPTLGGGFTTIWTYNGNTVSQAALPGMYIQEVEDANGCVAQDTFFMSTIDCDTVPFGIGSHYGFNYTVYPNPSSGPMYLDFERIANDIQIRVIDGLGKIVAQEKAGVTQYVQLDLSALAKGIYILEVNADGIRHRSRWVLQ